MSNAAFPSLIGQGWSVIKTPQWSSRVQRSTGGMELRASYYSLPIWRWTLLFNALPQTTQVAGDFSTLAGFFNARQGMFDSFLYSDPSDNTIPVAAPMAFGVGTGTRTVFPFTRAIGSGQAEPVYNLNGAPILYNNGSPISSGGYSIANGAVTFATAPTNGHALTWSGGYYWRCRFDQDSADFENFASLFWAQKGLSFVSVKGS